MGCMQMQPIDVYLGMLNIGQLGRNWAGLQFSRWPVKSQNDHIEKKEEGLAHGSLLLLTKVHKQKNTQLRGV